MNRENGQELWDNLSRHFQTYQYSDIYISHEQWGWAINKDWEYNILLGGYAFVKYVGTPVSEGIQIPGYQPAGILAIAIITITGIGYSLNRKRKRG